MLLFSFSHISSFANKIHVHMSRRLEIRYDNAKYVRIFQGIAQISEKGLQHCEGLVSPRIFLGQKSFGFCTFHIGVLLRRNKNLPRFVIGQDRPICHFVGGHPSLVGNFPHGVLVSVKSAIGCRIRDRNLLKQQITCNMIIFWVDLKFVDDGAVMFTQSPFAFAFSFLPISDSIRSSRAIKFLIRWEQLTFMT